MILNKDILSAEIQKFIKDHENHDPFALLLKHKQIAGIPINQIVLQIQARQKARKKLPEWYNANGIVWPLPVSLEQSSSQQAAEYKSSLFKGKLVVDLTGGLGIDTYYFSKRFDEAIYLEKDERVSLSAGHNFQVLGALNIRVLSGTAEDFVCSMPKADLVYIDPSRRTHTKVFLMKDSEPDVGLLLPCLFNGASNVLIKLSPLMDISQAMDELPNVFKVHVVAIGNEVKETLFHLKSGFEGEPLRMAVNLTGDDRLLFEFKKSQELAARVTYDVPKEYLYEPFAPVLKAGAFKLLSQRYNVSKLHINSHLYTSEKLVREFPGKLFKIDDIFKYDRKLVSKHLSENKANLVVRNFPLSVEKIRVQTKIKEGGEDFLFFTTDMNGKKIVIKAVKC